MHHWRTTEITALSTAGGCAMRASALTGRSPRAVQDMARRMGLPVPVMPHACYRGDADRRRVARMRASGMSVRQVSEATGVPFGTVRRWVYQSKE